jgi:hypothetical protein
MSDATTVSAQEPVSSRLRIEDQFVRLVMSCVLIAVLLLMVGFNFFMDLLAYVQISNDNIPPEWAMDALDRYRDYGGIPATFGGPVMQLLPGLITVFCFSTRRPILSHLGRIVFLLDILLILFSGVFLSQVVSPGDLESFLGGQQTYSDFHDVAQASFGLGWAYLGMLTGLSIIVPGPAPAEGDPAPPGSVAGDLLVGDNSGPVPASQPLQLGSGADEELAGEELSEQAMARRGQLLLGAEDVGSAPRAARRAAGGSRHAAATAGEKEKGK